MEGTGPDTVTRFEYETWSRCASGYPETFAVLTNQSVPFLVEAAGIERGTRVLEIGTGPGNVAGRLAAAGADVDAVDFSESMLEIARREHPGVRFHQTNAEELPFKSSTFGAVVANFVVHHLARPDAVFGEACRVLNRGGRFAFAVWGPPEEQSSIGAFFAAVEAHHDLADLPHGPLFGVTDRATYEPLLTAAGLTDVRFESREIAWRSASLDPILRGFWDWGDIGTLPEDVQDRIEASTRENAEAFEQGGQYVFPHTVLVVSAKRG